MRVLNTSAWIEWIVDSSTGAALRPEVPSPATLIVPTVVQLELAKWLNREAPGQTSNVIGFTKNCVVVPLDTELALQAAVIGRVHRLATADAVVYATAIERGADLLTCDAHFKDLPGVIYVPKN